MAFKKYERKHPGRYAECHSHSEYSDGAKYDYKLIKASEIEAIAMTDHEDAFGIHEHYYEMKKIGKIPIIGAEFNVGNMLSSLTGVKPNHNKKYYHLVLIIKNEIGLKNFYKLVTLAKRKKVYEKVHINIKELIDHREGLICLSGCIGGEIPQYLLHGEYQYAHTLALTLKEVFQDDFYLEIQRHNLKGEDKVNEGLISLSSEISTPLVATSDAHYLIEDEDHRKAYEIRMCKKYNQVFSDEKRFKIEGEDFALLKPIEKIEAKWWDQPQALDSTIEIMEKVKDLKLEKASNVEDYHFPKFNTPDGFNEQVYFIKKCYEGYDQKVANGEIEDTPESRERLNLEMNTIIESGFEGYFLIVQKIVSSTKLKDIWVGPGRGSVGGSYVAFVLGITTRLNPMDYNFLFERFINPFRQGMPDIDLDFDSLKRNEVLQDTIDEYDLGEEIPNTAYIATFMTWGARGGINDVGRILGYEDKLYRGISKLVPNLPDMTLQQALKESPKLKEKYDNDERVREIIKYALLLEGTKTSLSKHPSGFIIADKPLDNYVPLYEMLDKETGKYVTVVQCNMKEAEEKGLLKIDFLGLATGTQVAHCCKLINKNLNSGEYFDINEIPLDDANVYYDIFGKGNTLGIFQSESASMTGVLMKIFNTIKKYNNNVVLFLALIQGICLNRPGPKACIPQFLENLANPEKITYLHEKLKPTLEETFGTLTYQEQVSMLFQELASYSPQRADVIRAAISKKKFDVLESEKEIFIYGNSEILGCINNGISEEIALEIFDTIVDFGKYAFNKSHGGSYGLLTYQTAYLKHHYPVEFMTALLSSCCRKNDSIKKLPSYIQECKRMGIKILPPDVSKSNTEFTIEGDNAIRFGLLAIKHVGENLCDEIVSKRGDKGFKDLESFISELQDNLTSQTFKALALSGALDCFDNTRKYNVDNVDSILKNTSGVSTTERLSLLLGLAVNTKKDVSDQEEYSTKDLILYERDYLRTFVSINPLSDYQRIISDSNTNSLSEIMLEQQELDDLDTMSEDDLNLISFKQGMIAKTIGLVTHVDARKDFIIFEITDGVKVMQTIVNSRYKNIIEVGNVIHLSGKVDHNPSYGTQIKEGVVSRVFSSNDSIYKEAEVIVRSNSAVEAYIDDSSQIYDFKKILDIDTNAKSSTTLYFYCNNSKKIFEFNHKIPLKDSKVLAFLKENTHGLIIR